MKEASMFVARRCTPLTRAIAMAGLIGVWAPGPTLAQDAAPADKPADATAADTPAEAAPSGGLASPWVETHKSRSRLSAGKIGMDADGKGGTLYGFVEIELQDGWKTYWRSPGDSGIPPRIDASKSQNIADPVVLYPAPKRITDKGETIIGYTGTVVFPVTFKIEDASKPVDLNAAAQFGICKDICVPIDAALQLTVPETLASLPSKSAIEAVNRVPRQGSAIRPTDPKLVSGNAGVANGLARIVIKADFPGGTTGADAMLEAPDGLYLPLLTKTGETGTEITFEADLTKDVDLTALAGKDIRVTFVSKAGASEATLLFN
jgi:DsbC/DsbD-like thiol-disulfide interchange protein